MKSVLILILGMILSPIGRLAFEQIFNWRLKNSLMDESAKKEAAKLARLTAYNEKRYKDDSKRSIDENGEFIYTIAGKIVSEETWEKYTVARTAKANEKNELQSDHDQRVDRIDCWIRALAPGRVNPLKLYHDRVLTSARENMDKHQVEIPAGTLVTFSQSVVDPSITPPPSHQ